MEREYKTIKIRAETLKLLRKLYTETGLPMITIVEKLVRAEWAQQQIWMQQEEDTRSDD